MVRATNTLDEGEFFPSQGDTPRASMLAGFTAADAPVLEFVCAQMNPPTTRACGGAAHTMPPVPAARIRDRLRYVSKSRAERTMKVILRHPQRREIELPGRRRVEELLRELHVHPDTVLVIRGRELLTRDVVLREDDVIEIRPVISGGARTPLDGR